ncbi:MAG: hypothetical protein H6672_19360 [Anaerolineaceae bacterium]|nr:hypothetical protein [Anaerolineaceae bacterium]
MTGDDREGLHKVQQYRKMVLVYEALNAQIDALLAAHRGDMMHMPPEEKLRYRELAQKRDEMLNDMRTLEQELHIGDEP